MSDYRWATPQDWLREKAREWDKAKLYQELITLADRMTEDELQDEYQREMDMDEYFTPLN